MAIALRPDFDSLSLRLAARASDDPNQVRRLLTLAAIYDGSTRRKAAAIGGVTLQIVWDWVLKFNASGPEGLIDRKAPGKPPLLDGKHLSALAEIVESGPIPAIHGVVRWRIIDLCQWLWEEFQISVSKQTLSRELRAMNYRKLSARPRHHAQAAGAIEGAGVPHPQVGRSANPTGASLDRTPGARARAALHAGVLRGMASTRGLGPHSLPRS